MEKGEFRQKLYEYLDCMDSSTFINSFLDASKKHGDNLEPILLDMESAKEDYKEEVRLYAERINNKK